MRTSGFALGAFGLLVAAQLSFAATAPDLPIAGWATQSGGTTGGKGYPEVTVSTLSELQKYAKAGNAIVYLKPGTYETSTGNAVEITGNNLTIYGYQGAMITQKKTNIKNEDNTAVKVKGNNIIIRNITIKGPGSFDLDAGDCLDIKGSDDGKTAQHIWIDHVTIWDGQDGNLDIVHGANYVTLSWVKFHYTTIGNHNYCNLVGHNDGNTSDEKYLKVTFHHNWWTDGVKERMPRVRFGQVHVANNLFTSNSSNYCVRAGMKANIRVESNVFIGVNDPLNYNNKEKENATVSMVGNYFEKTEGNTAGQGTAFTPPYSMPITKVDAQAGAYALRDSIEAYAGATLPDPGSSTTPTKLSSSSAAVSSSSVKSSSSVAVSSSSSVKSSSSVAAVSSSSVKSSSSAVTGAAALVKHGTGSANQSVAQGAAIIDFSYSWTGATGVTVAGLPDGVTAVVDPDASSVAFSGTVSPTVAVGAYKFTVTTTGAATNASKSGTITVVAGGAAASSSSSKEVSSSSEEGESSSSESEEVSSSSGTAALPMVNVTASKLSVNPVMLGSARVTLEVNYQGAAKIVLMDMSGRAVMNRVMRVAPGANEIVIDRGTLPSGAYFIKVNTAFDNLQGRILAQ